MPTDEDLEDGMEGKKAGSPWRIFGLARPEWPWLGAGLVLLVGSLVPMLLLPLVTGRILDTLANTSIGRSEQQARTNRWIVFLLLAMAGGTLCAFVRSFIFNAAGERVVARLRIMLFRAIISQEIGLFDRRKTGELLSRLSSDTTSLQDVATSQVSMFFRGVIQLLFNAFIMFYTSWKLTLVVFGVVPLVVICIAMYGRRVRKVATQYSDALGLAADTAQESISNIRTVRSFAGEDVEVAKYTQSVGDPDANASTDAGGGGGGNGCSSRSSGSGSSGWLCWLPPPPPTDGPAFLRRPSTYRVGIIKQALTATFIAFSGSLGVGALIMVVWYGSRLVIAGEMTVGELVSFMLYAVQIGASIGMMSGLVGQMYVALGASKRTFQLIDRDPRIPTSGGLYPEEEEEEEEEEGVPSGSGGGRSGVESEGIGEGGGDVELAGSKAATVTPATSATAARGHIEFEDVHFAYPSRSDVPVLEGFSVDVPVNATVAFVGTSGSGKSTVLALLERFYDPSAGRVLLDGHDLAALDPRFLRRSVALVAQEPVLFGLTIGQNIAYGFAAAHAHGGTRRTNRSSNGRGGGGGGGGGEKEAAEGGLDAAGVAVEVANLSEALAAPSQAAIEAAAKAAFAHDFITGFPDGYGTMVGERGVRLSGGQKQRIAIARALLVNPRVLLLDEATSALDSESERLVQKAIDAFMKERTTLVVAHRLSTVRHADRIVLLAGGKVAASGTHDELMESSPAYAELVRNQLQAGSSSSSSNGGNGQLTTSSKQQGNRRSREKV